MCTAPYPGTGAINGRLLIVGDYPHDESMQSFAPDAWDLLTTLLEEIGAIEWAAKNEDDLSFINDGIYFTTAVKCGTKGRHKPRATEMKACRQWLGAQLGIMSPDVVVIALGNLAMASVTGKPLTKCKVSFGHGVFEKVKGRLFVASFHPNYVIRRGHTEWGFTRDQLRTDLDSAWRAANRGFLQPQES